MADLEALLRIIYEGHERTNVEYKRSISWTGEMRFKLVKAILSMANYGGGYIVIGFDEDGKTLQEQATGVDESDLGTWQLTNVCRDLNNCCRPPMDLDLLSVLDPEKGVTFVVLRVPSHGSEPFLSSRDQNAASNELLLKKGALYYRARDKSCGEISDQQDWRDLITRLTLNRKSELLSDIEHIMSGRTQKARQDEFPLRPSLEVMNEFVSQAVALRPTKTESLAFREILVVPCFEWHEPDIESVQQALIDSSYDYRGWPYLFFLAGGPCAPQYADGSIRAHSNEPFFGKVLFYYWNFRYATGEFYSQNLSTESSVGHPEIIDPIVQVELWVEALLTLGRLYSALDVSLDETIELTLRYTGLENSQVGSVFGTHHILPSRQYSDAKLVMRRRISLNTLVNAAASEAAALVLELIRRIGYTGSMQLAGLENTAVKYLEKGVKVPYPA